MQEAPAELTATDRAPQPGSDECARAIKLYDRNLAWFGHPEDVRNPELRAEPSETVGMGRVR